MRGKGGWEQAVGEKKKNSESGESFYWIPFLCADCWHSRTNSQTDEGGGRNVNHQNAGICSSHHNQMINCNRNHFQTTFTARWGSEKNICFSSPLRPNIESHWYLYKLLFQMPRVSASMFPLGFLMSSLLKYSLAQNLCTHYYQNNPRTNKCCSWTVSLLLYVDKQLKSTIYFPLNKEYIY